MRCSALQCSAVRRLDAAAAAAFDLPIILFPRILSLLFRENLFDSKFFIFFFRQDISDINVYLFVFRYFLFCHFIY